MEIELKRAIKLKQYKQTAQILCSLIHPRLFTQIQFFRKKHRTINFKNPKTLDEVMNILKITEYYNNPAVRDCADKVKAREYVANKLEIIGMHEVLNEVFFVTDNPDDIDYDSLPDAFALKCNHGCGYNIIIPDKSKFSRSDLASAKEKLKCWMQEDYSVYFQEYHYHGIKSLTYCEEYIGTPSGEFPGDLKFFCSYGRALACMMCSEREVDLKLTIVDRNYKDLCFIHKYNTHTPYELEKLKPRNWKDLIKVAELLSEDFPFVRIDLYEIDGKIRFGEFTFTGYGCFVAYVNDEGQVWFANEVKKLGWPKRSKK